ncbi:MAG: hypothetical protein JWN40_5045 [Phycisphaerales bacterium]|nr:hypothetical protein [Phycisphaerales bacterium]
MSSLEVTAVVFGLISVMFTIRQSTRPCNI